MVLAVGDKRHHLEFYAVKYALRFQTIDAEVCSLNNSKRRKINFFGRIFRRQHKCADL